LGDFPRSHRLLNLVRECVKLCPELGDLLTRSPTLINHIEDAYVMCYDKEYEEAEVREMLAFRRELLNELANCAGGK
jgi:DNA primase large subunit